MLSLGVIPSAGPQHGPQPGWSTADFWFTRDWSWNETSALYTHPWGAATGPTREDSPGVFSRSYDGGQFHVDCNTLKARIEPGAYA